MNSLQGKPQQCLSTWIFHSMTGAATMRMLVLVKQNSVAG